MCEWKNQSSMKVSGQLCFWLLWAHVRQTGCVRTGVCAYIVATPLKKYTNDPKLNIITNQCDGSHSCLVYFHQKEMFEILSFRTHVYIISCIWMCVSLTAAGPGPCSPLIGLPVSVATDAWVLCPLCGVWGVSHSTHGFCHSSNNLRPIH